MSVSKPPTPAASSVPADAAGPKVDLRIEQLHLAYEGLRGLQTVVKDFNLFLPAGHIGCLLGASGCGKSTVLRAIAGFEPVRGGCIYLGERLLSSPQVHIAPQVRQVGLMFQEYSLFPHLDVAANIGFGLRRLTRAQRQARVRDMLALVGLDGLLMRFPHELSGGQQQRVALARALAPAPALILLDEPFSSLDQKIRRHLAIEVRDILRRAGQTAVLVTHNVDEAGIMADFIAEMQDGRIKDWRPVVYEPSLPAK